MKKYSFLTVIAAGFTMLMPHQAYAQGAPGNVPAQARQAESDVERTVRRFGIGVQGGIGLDPELIEFGAHGRFGPFFRRNITFRPGLQFGVGEVTTAMGIDLDVLYALPGATRTTRWTPYLGAGPNFSLSHRGFSTDTTGTTTTTSTVTTAGTSTTTTNRFNFSDTDFNGGINFIAGAYNQSNWFLEMKATAYGVSNVKLLIGVNF